MTRHEHLLIILAEECAETMQRASKMLRFTANEIQPGQESTNSERLISEFNDLIAVMEMLKDEGLVDNLFDEGHISLKKEKVEKFLEYSKSLGTVS